MSTCDLAAVGHDMPRSHLSYAAAGVHGVEAADESWRAAADPGRDGMALIVRGGVAGPPIRPNDELGVPLSRRRNLRCKLARPLSEVLRLPPAVQRTGSS